MSVLKTVVSSLVLWQGRVLWSEISERSSKYHIAREYANKVSKPMLVVGGPGAGDRRSLLVKMLKLPMHGCGDVCLDIDAGACKVCGQKVETIVADVRDIPYSDHYFGSVFVSHVLEHLPSEADAMQAVEELYRVGERVFVVSPSKTSLIAWLHPGHHLWVKQEGDEVWIQPWPRS